MSNDMLDGQLSIYSKPRWPSKPKTMFTDILIIVVFLGIFIGLMVMQRHIVTKLKAEAYRAGHDAGYELGLDELEIYKIAAIQSGVAYYEVTDELKGTVRFCLGTNSIPVIKASTE